MRLFIFILLTISYSFAEFNITNKVTQIISELKPNTPIIQASIDNQEENETVPERVQTDIYEKAKIISNLIRCRLPPTLISQNNIWTKVYSIL